MRPSPLGDADIARRLAASRWRREGATIVRSFELESFAAAVDFVVAVAAIAEQRDHHPDISLSWRTVRISWTTHSAGGLTDLDFELAAAVDAIA